MTVDPSDPSDSPPIHETPEEPQEEHAEDSHEDLTHAELGEAVAAARTPVAAPKKPRRKSNAQGASTLGFLRLENLPSDKGTRSGPLAVWIIIQLVAVAAAAGRWKLWATEGVGVSESIELLALHLLMVVQIVACTLMYPILLDGWTKLAWAIATAVAFDGIAWVMTGVGAMAAVWTGGFVVTWIVGLAMWRAAVPGAVGTMLIRLFLTLLVLGWPIVIYLNAEFAANGAGTLAGAGGGPLPIALGQLTSAQLARQTWMATLALAGSGGAVWLIRTRPFRNRRRGRVLDP